MIFVVKSDNPYESEVARIMERYKNKQVHIMKKDEYKITTVIDRRKWKKCEVCGKADGAITATYATEDMQGFTITNHSLYAKYCPQCGRPLKEEAWKELERKVFDCAD